MKNMLKVVALLLIMAPIFILPSQLVRAQYGESDCQYRGQMSLESAFSRSSEEIVCLNLGTLHTLDVNLFIRSGTIRLFYTQDITTTFRPRGEFTARGESYPFSITHILDLPYNTPTLMIVPFGSANYQLEFIETSGQVSAPPECDYSPYICPSDTPLLISYPVVLDRVGDRTQLYVDVCPGEFQVTVAGVPERNDVYIHIYPLGGTVPRIEDPPNVTRASNLGAHSLVSWQQISSAQAQAYPVWIVYVTRNGYDRSRTLRLNVHIDLVCGRTSLQDARPPQNSFRTSPRQGDTLLPGGVSVQNYCNYYNQVARSVNDQYWVCFSPITMEYRTLEPSDFDLMCQQQHDRRNAYGVKRQPGAGGLECYE